MNTSASTLSLTGRPWIWPDLVATRARSRSGVPAWIEAVLAHRGIAGAAIGPFLSPSLSTVDDPALMADMPKAVARLERAVLERTPITVWGDYDVDGVCATTLLVDFLRQVGARVDYYIPDRRSEGYGLNADAIRRLAGSTRLLVAVDCGITAVAEVKLASELGMEVVIVDHHRPGDELPPAVANLDPHRADCPYPFKHLCAAGLAFLLAGALRRSLRDAGAFAAAREPDVRELLDLVALATVADMVPLSGTNRTLVAAGLRRIAEARRPGVRALLEVSKVEPEQVNAFDLAFRLAPRINAGGRVAHAAAGVEFLLTSDSGRAAEIAAALDAANRERRDLEARTTEAAVANVEGQHLLGDAALVLCDPTWHAGVLGLVATRLVARFQRPAVVIGERGKGSARSVEGLDLYDTLRVVGHHLERFGGHRAAAGVTLREEQLLPFRAAFAGEVESRLGRPPFVRAISPELEVDPSSLDLEMVMQAQRLEPFGQDNPEPLLAVRNIKVVERRLVGDAHLKLKLGDGLDAIGFHLGKLLPQLPPAIDAVFTLGRNSFRGRDSLQLKLTDLRAATPR